MRRRSATTGFIVKSSRVLHETVGVLSDPERGIAMRASGTTTREVGLWRTMAASLGSEFVFVPLRFGDENKFAMMSEGQECLHTRL